jgi:hypothetical protein
MAIKVRQQKVINLSSNDTAIPCPMLIPSFYKKYAIENSPILPG